MRSSHTIPPPPSTPPASPGDAAPQGSSPRPAPSRRRRLFRWLKVLVLLYCVVGIAFYYSQDALLFHPSKVDPKTAYRFEGPYTELNLPYDQATSLNVIQFRLPGSDSGGSALPRRSTNDARSPLPVSPGSSTAPKGVVLYFHGNKDNISHYAMYAADFTRKGYEVWMLDYPGFGKSTGQFTEDNLYKYALIFYKLARSRFSPQQIIIYGKSLGTGIAAQLASVRDCRRLILETPYYSMQSLVRHYLPVYPIGQMLHYHFPTNEYLPAVTAPVTIFHGSSDRLIPLGNASGLKALLKPGDEFITIEGAGHNNLNDYPLFREKLDSVMER